jgi:hypothetical protein
MPTTKYRASWNIYLGARDLFLDEPLTFAQAFLYAHGKGWLGPGPLDLQATLPAETLELREKLEARRLYSDCVNMAIHTAGGLSEVERDALREAIDLGTRAWRKHPSVELALKSLNP